LAHAEASNISPGGGSGGDRPVANLRGQDVSKPNIDARTVVGFGEEWVAFDQTALDPAEQQRLFDAYFSIFPFQELPDGAEGFDLGCGSGRWATIVAGRVGTLHCIDPSKEALGVARRRLQP
jgi:methylase of polypeptide subunit release factors